MVIIQQLPLSLATFGEMSEYVLKRITSHPSKAVYFVADEYRDDSIKGSKRKRTSICRDYSHSVEQKRSETTQAV